MIDLFIKLRLLDIIDILLVSFLMYQLYMLIRGTAAISIFLAIFIIYALYLIVKALHMELLGSILEQVTSVGMIALIIVFQQEIRRFLVLIGSKYLSKSFSLNKMLSMNFQEPKNIKIRAIVNACKKMSESRTGALIVLTRKAALEIYANTGDIVNATISSRLIESIFFKNNPLHDGAMIILHDKIHAVRCIMPLSDNPNIEANFGMRHRAALGITENTDAIAIVVSEETGEISVTDSGVLTRNLNKHELILFLEREFTKNYFTI
jgi:diadenylate cyclase